MLSYSACVLLRMVTWYRYAEMRAPAALFSVRAVAHGTLVQQGASFHTRELMVAERSVAEYTVSGSHRQVSWRVSTYTHYGVRRNTGIATKHPRAKSCQQALPQRNRQ